MVVFQCNLNSSSHRVQSPKRDSGSGGQLQDMKLIDLHLNPFGPPRIEALPLPGSKPLGMEKEIGFWRGNGVG